MGVPKYCFTPSRVKKNRCTIKLASSISARVKRCLFMFEVMPLYLQGKSISEEPEIKNVLLIFAKVAVDKSPDIVSWSNNLKKPPHSF